MFGGYWVLNEVVGATGLAVGIEFTVSVINSHVSKTEEHHVEVGPISSPTSREGVCIA